jgi:hypothetical protein
LAIYDVKGVDEPGSVVALSGPMARIYRKMGLNVGFFGQKGIK